MKLQSDEVDVIQVFVSDFERACRKMARVLTRHHRLDDQNENIVPLSRSDIAGRVIKAARESLRWRGWADHLIENEASCPWESIEAWQASYWLGLIVERWVQNNRDPNKPKPAYDLIDPHVQEMFFSAAQRVAVEVAGPDYFAPDKD